MRSFLFSAMFQKLTQLNYHRVEIKQNNLTFSSTSRAVRVNSVNQLVIWYNNKLWSSSVRTSKKPRTFVSKQLVIPGKIFSVFFDLKRKNLFLKIVLNTINQLEWSITHENWCFWNSNHKHSICVDMVLVNISLSGLHKKKSSLKYKGSRC